MNIFENLDNLLRYGSNASAILESKAEYETLPIAPSMETAEQAEEYIRNYFKNILMGGGDDGGKSSTPSVIDDVLPPTPPISKDGMSSSGESKDWESGESIWDDDEYIDSLKIDGDEEDADDEDDKDEYDDFTDKAGGKSASKEGDDDGDDEGEGDEDDYDEDGGGDDEEGGDDDGEGEGGEDGDGKSGKGESKGGTTGGKSEGSSKLKSSVEDAIERLKERADADMSKLKKLSDMADSDTSDSTSEELDDIDKSIESEHDGKTYESMKDLIGKMEGASSEEEIKKEIEDAEISDEAKGSLTSSTVAGATVPPVMDSEELKKLKDDAIAELNKKCEGHSRLSSEILFHSLKDAKIESQDWKKIIEMILKDKSRNGGNMESKTKRSAWGNKNHMWRQDVVYPYKKEVVGGGDTQSIYCFVDYSGSVRSQSNLIISFLGKVMELCINLKYTDMVVYTFADKLSLPRHITKKMVDKDGYEKVLAQTIAYFDEPSNDVGGSIEDFSLVANEFNKIKSKDKHAVAFIFGDGVWTFYGNSQPPIRLKEMSARWLKDICAFVFYDTIDSYLKREISYLTDEVGIKNVITTKMKDIEPIGS